MTVEEEVTAGVDVGGVVVHELGHVAALLGVDEQTGVVGLSGNLVD